jgi:hypothetical protein
MPKWHVVPQFSWITIVRCHLRTASGIVLISISVVACTSMPTERERFAASPTPSAWVMGSSWDFYTVGMAGEPLGSFTLSLTDEPTETCIGGSWYRAEVVRNSSTIFPLDIWYSSSDLFPAYSIHGRIIEIVMNSGICDNYAMLNGDLTDTGANGRVAWEGMVGGQEVGRFVAEGARRQ